MATPSNDKSAVVPNGRLADPAWAWARYEPDGSRPWDLRLAGHLFRRAAFGASWPRLQKALADGPQKTIDALLNPPGEKTRAFNRRLDDYEASVGGATNVLRGWWLRRMMETPDPLREKLTLFWHNHFAISAARVNNAALMGRHAGRLREHALGNFAALLESLSGDPALFLGLEAKANRRARPEEYFARVLLERFVLGPGGFSDEDVRSTARAFTGWFVFQTELRFIAREHDEDEKRFLGETGKFGPEDVVRIAAKSPASARWIVRKLYREFIADEKPAPNALIDPLAERFSRGHDIRAVVETMLRSNLFYSPAAYRRKVKSPVEFALGFIRSFEGVVGATRLGADLAALGQDLYSPPTVAGWVGGRRWINRFTIPGRAAVIRALLSKSDDRGDGIDPKAAARQQGFADDRAGARFLTDLLLQGDLDSETRRALESGGLSARQLPEIAALLAGLPEYQLA